MSRGGRQRPDQQPGAADPIGEGVVQLVENRNSAALKAFALASRATEKTTRPAFTPARRGRYSTLPALRSRSSAFSASASVASNGAPKRGRSPPAGSTATRASALTPAAPASGKARV